STRDLGVLVRTVTPPGQAAMLAHWTEPAMFYYADRPLRLEVWDAENLKTRLNDGWADLPYHGRQDCSVPSTRFVIPKISVHLAQPLVRYLQEHYKSIPSVPNVEDKFLIFDLTAPLK